ncbi:MAG: glycerophosphoryl diester phosphodiesterase [marine bacterium B5-7]|nr:MAG: glycerophosphoryl diester phosphodiesterase [marine bacterium B5-7]
MTESDHTTANPGWDNLTIRDLISTRFTIQGHRGARGVLPENTLESIRYALDVGVDLVEIDINLSADDALLIVHDETTRLDLVRDSEGQWVTDHTPWRAMTREQVNAFDVGRIRPDSIYAARFAEQESRDGARIPLLEDVARIICERPHGGINMEIKCNPNAPMPRPDIDHLASRVVEAIDRLQIGHRVIVQSFNFACVAAIRALDPSLITGCLTSEQIGLDTIGRDHPEPSPWTAGLHPRDFDGSVPAMVHSLGVDYWSSEHRDLRKESVDEAHSLGLNVHAWTVNDAKDIERLICWGVDSIISDYPDMLARLITKCGR